MEDKENKCKMNFLTENIFTDYDLEKTLCLDSKIELDPKNWEKRFKISDKGFTAKSSSNLEKIKKINDNIEELNLKIDETF